MAEVARQGELLASGLAISMGIAALDTATNLGPDDLLVAADNALHRAKAAGGSRGHVAVPQDLGSPPVWGALAHLTGRSAER